MDGAADAVAFRDWIVGILEMQSSWRAQKATDWPDDPRNARSSNALAAAAQYVRTLDPQSRRIRQFVELGEILNASGLNGSPDAISGSHVAGRFCFDRGPAPTTASFDHLIDSMFRETLEIWADVDGDAGVELPAPVEAYLASKGVQVLGWDDDEPAADDHELGPALPHLVTLHYNILSDQSKSSLERLSSLRSLRLNLETADLALGLDARAKGETWDEIGLRLGMTADDAHRRFGAELPA